MSQAETQEQYARIVTNEEEMREILTKIRMKGKDTDGQTTSLVQDTILHFEDDRVVAKAFDPMKSVWMHYRGPFSGIRREGSLVIGDISEFLSYLGRFGEKTIVEESVSDDGDILEIQFNDEDRKEGGYPAEDEEHITSIQNVEELPFVYDAETDEFPYHQTSDIELSSWFETDVAEIKDVLADGDTTQVRTYPISLEDGHVQVSVGDDSGYIQTDFQASEGEGDAGSVFGYGMDNVYSNLSGEVKVYLGNDAPMWIHQEEEGVVLDYMIANDE